MSSKNEINPGNFVNNGLKISLLNDGILFWYFKCGQHLLEALFLWIFHLGLIRQNRKFRGILWWSIKELVFKVTKQSKNHFLMPLGKSCHISTDSHWSNCLCSFPVRRQFATSFSIWLMRMESYHFCQLLWLLNCDLLADSELLSKETLICMTKCLFNKMTLRISERKPLFLQKSPRYQWWWGCPLPSLNEIKIKAQFIGKIFYY